MSSPRRIPSPSSNRAKKRSMSMGASALQPAKKDDTDQPHIPWDRTSRRIVVAADRSFLSLLARLRRDKAAWVVIVRTVERRAEPYYYAFRAAEIEAYSAVVSSDDES